MTDAQPGVFYIVSTPLGHLGDISSRALEILRLVNRIAAEDTRHTGALLRHFSIPTPCISCHDHNESGRIEQLLEYLLAGESLALVSDAGTPLISDPGFKLVRALTAAGIQVVPIPGACAITTALVASGLPTDRFAFFGFPPVKSMSRVKWLQALNKMQGTLVFYESKHRLAASLQDMLKVFGDVQACVARELTKEYESFYRGSLTSIIAHLAALPSLLGEFVVLLDYTPAQADQSEAIPLSLAELQAFIASPPSKKSLAAFLGKRTGLSKQDWYKQIVDQEL